MTRKKAIAKVDAGEASFAEWFVAQYGPQSIHSRAELQETLEEIEHQAGRLRFELACITRWEDARDAALKAWQASKDQQPKRSE